MASIPLATAARLHLQQCITIKGASLQPDRNATSRHDPSGLGRSIDLPTLVQIICSSPSAVCDTTARRRIENSRTARDVQTPQHGTRSAPRGNISCCVYMLALSWVSTRCCEIAPPPPPAAGGAAPSSVFLTEALRLIQGEKRVSAAGELFTVGALQPNGNALHVCNIPTSPELEVARSAAPPHPPHAGCQIVVSPCSAVEV